MGVFDIKFTRQGFCERLLTLRGLPSDLTGGLEAKPKNLISKDAKLVFYLSVYKMIHSIN